MQPVASKEGWKELIPAKSAQRHIYSSHTLDIALARHSRKRTPAIRARGSPARQKQSENNPNPKKRHRGGLFFSFHYTPFCSQRPLRSPGNASGLVQLPLEPAALDRAGEAQARHRRRMGKGEPEAPSEYDGQHGLALQTPLACGGSV